MSRVRCLIHLFYQGNFRLRNLVLNTHALAQMFARPSVNVALTLGLATLTQGG